jgi:pimeloyl-ACP methyl ester carboxylesterase
VVPPARLVTLPTGVELALRHWPGSGDASCPVLCLHGLASNARLWTDAATHLSELGTTVVAVDQRGHGSSSKPDAGYDLATVCADAHAVLDHLRWDRAVVVGQSWGGNVAVELARLHPERVLAVVAVDGGIIELQDRFPRWEDCLDALAPPVLIGAAASWLRAQFETWHPDWPASGVDAAMANFELRDDGTVAPWLTRARHLLALRGLWEHRPSLALREVAAPVLLVAAEGDDPAWVLDKRAAAERARSVGRHVEVEWMRGDHDLHAHRPSELAGLVHRWLEATCPAS